MDVLKTLVLYTCICILLFKLFWSCWSRTLFMYQLT